MDATTPFDDLDLDEPRPEPPTRRIPWVLVAGVIPWLVLLGLVLRPDQPIEEAPTESSQVSGAVSPEPAGAPTVPAATPRTAGAVIAATTGAVPTVAEAGAVAVVVARAHLTGVGPILGLAGADPAADRYVEHLSLESVIHPGPGAALATVLAVVLTLDGDRYDGVEVIRLAVPLSFDARGAAPAGPPWPLLPPDLADRPLTTGEPITDPVLLTEAGAAISAAGFTVDAVSSLVATASWPLVATVEATAPGDDAPRTHTVWLRSHLGDLVVAGSDLSRQDRP